MDNTTKWLVRGASAVVIGAGLLLIGIPVVSVLTTEVKALKARTYCFFNECFKYSGFLQAVKEGHVERIMISADTATALIEMKDGKEGKVDLVPDHDLLKLLNENNVEINVLPPNTD